jgi:hypothetical protein
MGPAYVRDEKAGNEAKFLVFQSGNSTFVLLRGSAWRCCTASELRIASRNLTIESARSLRRPDLSASKRGDFKHFFVTELRTRIGLLRRRWRGHFLWRGILRAHEQDLPPKLCSDTSAVGRPFRLCYEMLHPLNRTASGCIPKPPRVAFPKRGETQHSRATANS